MKTRKDQGGSKALVRAEVELPKKKVAERLVLEEEHHHPIQGGYRG